MKIRIRANTVRLRLTKTDIKNLKEVGFVEEHTVFAPNQIFSYTLSKSKMIHDLMATFENGGIHVTIPESQSQILTDSEEIGVQGHQSNGDKIDLFILIEKDLKCLDHTTEDQSDMYENPHGCG